MHEIPRPKKILMIRLSALGDVVNTLPALRLVRGAFPEAFIGWAVEDRARDIVASHPDVNEVFVFERRKWARGLKDPSTFGPTLGEILRFARRIRRRGFDVVLDFQGNAKSALHAIFSAAPFKVGFAKAWSRDMSHLARNVHVQPADGKMNRVEQNLMLAQAVCGCGPTEDTVRPGKLLKIPRESIDRAEEFVRRRFGKGAEYAVFHPGTSSFGAFKRWPAERYAELGRKLSEGHGLFVILTWSGGERKTAEDIVARIGPKAAAAPETRNVMDLAALSAKAKIFVGSDSGPLHLASAVGTPTVGLYGPKDPAVYAPYFGRGAVVRKKLACSPCTKRRCDAPECMTLITVDEVLEAAAGLL
jgi:heptosyltransferase-1